MNNTNDKAMARNIEYTMTVWSICAAILSAGCAVSLIKLASGGAYSHSMTFEVFMLTVALALLAHYRKMLRKLDAAA